MTNARVLRCDWADENSAAGVQNKSFDKILVDAPCSNTGVLRRRVDLRWRLRPDDFSRMPCQQLAILRTLAPLLKPGGSLVYSTCSLEPEENDQVVEAFLHKHPEFRLTNQKRVFPSAMRSTAPSPPGWKLRPLSCTFALVIRPLSIAITVTSSSNGRGGLHPRLAVE